MTDNEIIKALECCISTGTELDCFKCPMAENRMCYGSNTKVSHLVVKNAISLINRQKAEIERLKEHKYILEKMLSECCERIAKLDKLNETARAKAIKEVAERAKMLQYYYSETEYTFDFDGVTVEDIDNLLKEMTEDEGK